MPNLVESIQRRLQPAYAGFAASAALGGAAVQAHRFPDARFNAILVALIALVAVLGLSLRAFVRRGARARSGFAPALRFEPGLVSAAPGELPAGVARAAAPALDTGSWNAALLNALAPQRFAAVCAACFGSMGFSVHEAQPAEFNAVDLRLYGEAAAQPTAVARCFAARTVPVGADELRALLAARRDAGAAQAVAVSATAFTRAARELADGTTLRLLDGHDLLWKLDRLEPAQRDALRALATEGDFTARAGGAAAAAEYEYWGRLLP